MIFLETVTLALVVVVGLDVKELMSQALAAHSLTQALARLGTRALVSHHWNLHTMGQEEPSNNNDDKSALEAALHAYFVREEKVSKVDQVAIKKEPLEQITRCQFSVSIALS